MQALTAFLPEKSALSRRERGGKGVLTRRDGGAMGLPGPFWRPSSAALDARDGPARAAESRRRAGAAKRNYPLPSKDAQRRRRSAEGAETRN